MPPARAGDGTGPRSRITPRTEEAVNRLFLFAATAGTRQPAPAASKAPAPSSPLKPSSPGKATPGPRASPAMPLTLHHGPLRVNNVYPHAAGLLGPSITTGQGEVPSEGPAEDV